MEKALAAIHHAIPVSGAVAFEYGAHEGRVGVFLNFSDDLEQIITSPVVANYPQSALVPAPEGEIPRDWHTWRVDLSLTPDLFPILRHSQFEDLANRSFADPIDGLLRAATPTSTVPDSNGLQVREKSRVAVDCQIAHPTSASGRGDEHGRSTANPAAES